MESFWNLNSISSLMLRASKKALEMQPNLTIHTKTNTSNQTELYTNVDVFIENLISDDIQAQYPVNVIGEESISKAMTHTPLSSLLEDSIVIDPIDGTQNFINRLPTWAISLGRIKNFEFLEGAISLPIFGEMFISCNNQTYAFNAKSQLSLINTLELHAYKKPSLASEKYLTYVSSFYIAHVPHKLQIIRSCVYSIAKVLTGGYVAYVGKANIWDFAACIGLFRTLGLPVYYYKKDNNSIEILPWKITEEHWKDYIEARHPLIFTDSLEHAKTFLPQ